MGNANQPLVSVPVVTYNSSKTVVETLDSIFNQTYPNLELIVSDDCSTDNTVDICRDWIEAHKDRFVRTEMLTVEKNTGASANVNRAEAACRGEWVKGIAGDDLLLPECVEVYVDYVSKHSDAVFVFSRVELFGGTEESREILTKHFETNFFEMTSEQQYEQLVVIGGNHIPAATSFFNCAKVRDNGFFCDERIPFCEDWPRWLNLAKAGVEFHFVDVVTVKYRMSETSLSTGKRTKKYEQSLALIYLYYQFSYLYEHNNKKEALLNYIRARKTLSNIPFFWKVILNLYKTVFKVS